MIDTSRLIINPGLVILHRNGVIFTTKLENNDAQKQLHLIDVIFINEFLKINKSNVIDRLIVNKYVKHLMPVLDFSMVLKHINSLIDNRVLVSTSEKTSNKKKIKEEKNLTLENVLKKSSIRDDDKFRLSNDFELVPDNNGFKIYSLTNDSYFLLNLDELLVITLIANGNNIQNIASQLRFINKSLIRVIFKKLVTCNLLVEVDQSIKSKKTAIIKDYNINFLNQIGQKWQQIVADDRMPIYFVPHMENHFPLALGLLYSSIQSYKNSKLLKRFNLIPLTYFTPEILLNKVYRKFGKGIWLFSNYMWSLNINLEISKLVKAHDRKNITIHGGPSTPNYQEACVQFMNSNSSIDISVHGEGEIAIREILECIGDLGKDNLYSQKKLSEVPGLTFRVENQKNDGYFRTVDRTRMENPDSIPSPYTTIFDDYNGRVDAAIIESNRGCPFGCTFCDWGSATNQKVRKYNLGRTKDEIKWIGKNEIKIIWIADANYGMYDRDIELSKYIVKTKEKYGYPKEVVVNYTKNTTWRLAEIIKIFTQGNIISQGIISIQTTDKKTLEVINRKNIKTNKYDDLAKLFADENLPLSTDLMIGLPGITVEAFSKDLQRYIDLDVSVKAYPTQLLPNSPMANPEYLTKYKIITDSNDFIISSYSFNETELHIMKLLYKFYTIAEGYSLLRYITRYLQWHYKIQAIAFLRRLMDIVMSNGKKYPHIYWVFSYFDKEKCMPGGWNTFYQEILQFIKEEYSIEYDHSLKTVISVNELCMPSDLRKYPASIDLKHDFVAYYNQFSKNTKIRELKDFDPAVFTVYDPNHMVGLNHEDIQYDTHQYFWELDSEISKSKSKI